ncbi:MAG TPA: hypothetical protein VLJ39_17955, partial [Tepidisphaeraceae bacterium]|nr:hypothetical protein [Tepidisphaeraceae bacterium]
MIRLKCECGRKMSAPDQWLGKRVKCPQCGRPVLVQPVAEAVPAEAPAPAAVVETRPAAPLSVAREDHAGAESNFETGTSEANESVGASPATGVEEDNAQVPAFPSEAVRSSSSNPFEITEAAKEGSLVSHPLPTAPEDPPREIPPEPGQATLEIEDDYDRGRSRRGKVPRAVGLVALAIGLLGLAAFWVPQARAYSPFIAIAGVVVGSIGIGLAMFRRKSGLPIPALATVVSVAAVVVPFVLRGQGGTPPRSFKSVFTATETDPNAARRIKILRVDQVQPTGKQDALTTQLQYTITNTSGRAITSVEGSIEIFDRQHNRVGSLLLNLEAPIAQGGSTTGKDDWPLDKQVVQLI